MIKELNEFLKERNKAVTQGYEAFIEFAIKQNASFKFASDEVKEITFHKCRANVKSINKKLREESKKWLLEHNYSIF